MGKWAGKYVIGLTGNIGTGKSVVRRMLEHLGAFGIDADALSHRVILKGAPGYQPVLTTFGRWVLKPDGEIDRARLGRIVFSEPEGLALLESIIHPLVLQAVDYMVQRSSKAVIAIEAIKLLESDLGKHCNSVWAVVAPPAVQKQRLMQKRGMPEAEARQRISAQTDQEKKVTAAQVVIRNVYSFEDTWRQVSTAWQQHVPVIETAPAPAQKSAGTAQEAISVTRARPRDSQNIAALISRVKKDHKPTAADIMSEFGDKAFLLLRRGDTLVGTAGWQVENLVARTMDIVVEPSIAREHALPALIQEMERSSKDLQCEASLVFTTAELSMDALWHTLGYERRSPQSLGVSVWQDAARETLKPGQTLYFKQLRQDRVLRPI